MKKTIISILICFSTMFASAQSFNGVPISGELTTCVTKFKEKGFSLVKYIKNGAVMKGVINAESVELYIFTTPKSKKVCKVNVYLEENVSWYSLKRKYQSMVEVLTTKYGEPEDKLEYFSDPYYEGDGYELQAFTLEKAFYMTVWTSANNLSVSVEISKFKQIKISYENNIAMEVMKKEYEKLNAEAF